MREGGERERWEREREKERERGVHIDLNLRQSVLGLMYSCILSVSMFEIGIKDFKKVLYQG